jgi:hypothetical protein
MNNTNKKIKISALILLASALLIVTLNVGVNAQTQGSVFIYSSDGGTITADGTTVNGGSAYNYNVGTTVNFNAVAGTGFKFIAWETVTASGANTTTVNPLALNITSGTCAIQAIFISSTNNTAAATTTGATSVSVFGSVGGTTSPTGSITSPTTYTNYTIGTVSNFQANPSNEFKFLCWVTATASGGNTYTTSTLSLNITGDTAVQAFFIPTSSAVTVPTIPEYSTASIVIIAAILVAATFGTFAIVRKNKK